MSVPQQKIFNYEYKIAIKWLKKFFRPEMRDDWETSSSFKKHR
jgi:hypothetical protein